MACCHCELFCEKNVNSPITSDEKTTPNTVNTASTAANVQNKRFANSHTFFRGSLARYLVNTGMKEAVIEPSPTRRRSKLGILYAITNAAGVNVAASRRVFGGGHG